MEVLVKYIPYKFHEEIDSHTASYICTVADVKSVTELSLKDINSFLHDLFAHESTRPDSITRNNIAQ